MIHSFFAIRDRQLDAFGRPFTGQTRGIAVRHFYDEVQNKESPMNAHPEDYSLHFIGQYDDVNGRLIPSEPEQIALASDLG